jgi:hypothetical protein
MRQLKHTSAKAIHIFRNSNGNQREYAIVDFENQEDLEQAAKFTIKYFNTVLNWKEAFGEEQKLNFRRSRSQDIKYNENK